MPGIGEGKPKSNGEQGDLFNEEDNPTLKAEAELSADDNGEEETMSCLQCMQKHSLNWCVQNGYCRMWWQDED